MPRLRFKNFSDLSFIQSIDKPRHLQPLLAAHEEYFSREGIDVTHLANDDETDRELLRVFTQPDEEMPGDLLDALYILDDLADEGGHDRILDEAERQGEEVDGMADDLTPGEFAITVFREKPGLIRICHEKTIYRKIKNYQEYQAQGNKELKLGRARSRRKRLERALGPWFESKNRSRACEIYVYEESKDIKFLVTHGRPFRTDGSIDKRLNRSRVAYRPQKHDSVIFDNRTHILKVNSQTVGEKDLYRRTFGEVLFGDAEYFPAGDIYTLEPLRHGSTALRLATGVEAVRLTEAWIQIDDDLRFVQISRAYNLLDSIEHHQKPNLQEGQLVRAAFLIKYSSGGRARKLELRPPNIAVYDRERDGTAAEAFMHVNGYLKVGAQDDGHQP